jgi:hypothetical protein
MLQAYSHPLLQPKSFYTLLRIMTQNPIISIQRIYLFNMFQGCSPDLDLHRLCALCALHNLLKESTPIQHTYSFKSELDLVRDKMWHTRRAERAFETRIRKDLVPRSKIIDISYLFLFFLRSILRFVSQKNLLLISSWKCVEVVPDVL